MIASNRLAEASNKIYEQESQEDSSFKIDDSNHLTDLRKQKQ